MVNNRSTAAPDIVEGWAIPNATGSAIGLVESGDTYVISGARWAGPDNLWHDGAQSPTCVGTDTATGTRVQLGVINVDADHGSWPHVVWFRCLT